MAIMAYKAMDERGRVVRGRLEVGNLADLEARLARMGLDLISGEQTRQRGGARRARRIGRRDLIHFCFQLEQLTGAGVPVAEALRDLRDSLEERNLRVLVAGMVESIEGGRTLSEAMEEAPEVFDAVFTSLVRAGERSGEVGRVLRSVTEDLKWRDEQAAQIRKLLAYPLFVGGVTALVAVLLMTVLVPQLVSFLATMGEEIPLHTRALIALSDFFVRWWTPILGVPLALLAAGAALARVSPSLRHAIDDLKLRAWVTGPILRKIILARFASCFALMYASGIGVPECVRTGENLAGNRAAAAAMRRAGRRITEGASISAAFEQSALFPPLVLRMLRVGESTGALDVALRNVGYFYERDVREAVGRLQTLIGPVFTLVLGALLFWIIVAVLGPIYDVITGVAF